MKIDDLDFWCPALLWLRARKPGRSMRPLTHAEISERSGLPLGRVRWLAGKLDWKGCDLETIKAWIRGCNFAPSRQFREREFLKRSILRTDCPMPHLRALPRPEFALAQRMLKEIIRRTE